MGESGILSNQVPGRVKYKSESYKSRLAQTISRKRSAFSFWSFTWLLGRWYAPAYGEAEIDYEQAS